jgi:dihydrolipoamide dehydrogenase
MKYDVIIIGAGPGGFETAKILGKAGKKVALIEKDQVGGICLNRGCIPAKTMLYSAEMFRIGKKIKNYGIRFCQDVPGFDFEAMIKHRAEIMDSLRQNWVEMIEEVGVEMIYGWAELTGDNTVTVDGVEYEADHIVLATGGDARKFPGFVDDDERFLVSDNIFELKAFPESIFVLGAGPVGTEFATFFSTFGVKTHILDLGPTFLSYFDHDLGNELIKSFEEDGVNCYTNVSLESVDASEEKLKLKLSDGREIEVDKILSAIGMVPNMEYIKNDKIKFNERGRFVVNKSLQTTVPNIYAIGDANGNSGSAYGAEREGLYVAHHIMGDPLYDIPLDYAAFPDVIFTDPEVATCGLSEQECEQKGIDFVAVKVRFSKNGKAAIKGETKGFCKIIAERGSEKVLGVHIVGSSATELIHAAVIPVRDEVRVGVWLRKVWGHPVLSEIIKDALSELDGLL